MNNYFDEIKKRLSNKIKIEKIDIIDDTQKHKHHKSFSPGKLHLNLKINSIYLKSISRINAQKIIMKILKDDLKTKIHALQINIE